MKFVLTNTSHITYRFLLKIINNSIMLFISLKFYITFNAFCLTFSTKTPVKLIIFPVKLIISKIPNCYSRRTMTDLAIALPYINIQQYVKI